MDMNMIIDVENVFTNSNERMHWNCCKLEETVFVYDGREFKISKEEIEDWKMTGLNVVDFILFRDWEPNPLYEKFGG